jgi:uncharacterized protein with HEPN domain
VSAHDDSLYLVHIRECIERIEHYTASGKRDFLSDLKTQDAVLRNLHTLTESIQRLSPALRADQTAVDWRAIAAFRNVVVHDYLGVDLERVWDIVERDLPKLKCAVETMLRDMGGGATPASGL